MTSYALILIIHVTSVLVLFAVMSIEVVSLSHLRRAATLSDARPWIDPVRGLSPLVITSLLVILGTGIRLVMQMSASREAWPRIAVAALLVMAPIGALTGKRMRAIRKMARSVNANQSALLGLLRDPYLKISLSVRIAVFFGIFLLVNLQPGLGASIGIIVASVVLGLLASVFISRGSMRPVPQDFHS